MITLYIRYKFNPDKIAGIKDYFDNEQRVIERSGGKIVGYFMPTDFAGPNDEAIGLIDIPSVSVYEDYRRRLADDPEHKANVAALGESGATVSMVRSFIQRVPVRQMDTIDGYDRDHQARPARRALPRTEPASRPVAVPALHGAGERGRPACALRPRRHVPVGAVGRASVRRPVVARCAVRGRVSCLGSRFPRLWRLRQLSRDGGAGRSQPAARPRRRVLAPA